jgi:uncharacterized protein YrzB (UPF0473 family)
MSEEYGDSFITMVDENNQEFVLELLESIDYKGATYTAFLPAEMDENDPDYGLVLLRNAVDENGEEVYDTIDDDEELNDVYEQFMRILFDDEEEE